MATREILPLDTVSGRPFYYLKDMLSDLSCELETFLESESFLNSQLFSRKVMFTHELKANNNVEGIKDEVDVIQQVIDNARSITDIDRRNRIINLYRGYKYIIDGKDITEENVRKLYKILSNGLLKEDDLKRMGEKYRTAPVYILKNGRLDGSHKEGVPSMKIDEMMKCFFEYVHNSDLNGSQVEQFIKSQIMHFYFVHIHPYFDINGRTSRTVAMWYLLNNDVYSYIIFNRGINFDSDYDRLIRETEDTYNLTVFLKYMMVNVKKELEKEYVMQSVSAHVSRSFKTIDYQTIEYFLSLTHEEKSVLDFVVLYNRFNDKKKPKEIFEKMICPLIDDGVFDIKRTTRKNMYDEQPNLVLSLNKSKLSDVNMDKVSRIKL